MAPPLPYTLVLLYLLFHHFVSSSAVKFHKPSFNDPNDTTIIFDGGAARSNPGIIRLTNAQHPNEVSRVTYADKIPLWDSATGNLSDFTTHFSFSIAPKKDGGQKPKQLPCGISFFLAPFGFPVPANSAGGWMGLYNFTYPVYPPPNQVVHVEFDSYVNAAWDPPFFHVGINNNSIASSAFSPWEIDSDSDSLAGNHTITVEISYTASTHNLTVSWMNNETHQKNPSLLSYVIDLREALPEWVTVGFTATTNQIQGYQDLLWWDFTSNLEMSERDNHDDNRRKITAILAVPLGFAIAVKLILIGLSWIRKNKEEAIGGVSLLSMNVEFSKGAGPRWIPYNDLVSATNNFTTKLGEGGFGGVYKGILKGGLPVAVKKFSRRSSQGIQEYITEVRVISRLRHRNLVKLVGWCHDKGEFLLVYEFMPNGSLDSHLFGNGKKNNVVLQWAERYRVVMGLASALLYLHEEWEQCVVHRDIKAGNVMLDSGFNVKLGDFGLARMVDHELGAQTTRLAGTIGYMSPEYIGTGRASKESDVYSFGVVCLEMATGRRVVDYIEEGLEMGLVEWVWELYGNGNHGVAVDSRLLADGFDEREVECLIVVGLWCAHPDCAQRASIREAIRVLKFEAPFPRLPGKRPFPVFRVHEMDSSSSECSEQPLLSTVDLNSR